MKHLFPLLFLFVMSCSSKEENTSAQNEAKEKQEETSTVTSETEEPSEETTVMEEIDCSGNIRVYLSDPDLSGTNIRNEPNGKIVYKLIKTDENFEYFITATDSKAGWFKIESTIGGMESDITIESEDCWIHGSVLGGDTRNYGGQSISIFSDREKSKEVFQIKKETHFTLLDLCGDMVKIKWNDVNGTHEGWMDTDWLCGNPLTNCS